MDNTLLYHVTTNNCTIQFSVDRILASSGHGLLKIYRRWIRTTELDLWDRTFQNFNFGWLLCVDYQKHKFPDEIYKWTNFDTTLTFPKWCVLGSNEDVSPIHCDYWKEEIYYFPSNTFFAFWQQSPYQQKHYLRVPLWVNQA